MYKEGFSQYLLLGISLLGLALLRSNGLFVLAVWLVVLIFAYRSQSTKLKVTFLAALIVGFVLKNVVMSCLSVPQPDILESLAIPMQQITAVVHNGGKITPEQEATLSKLVSLDELSASYNPCWVDFAKKSIRDAGNVQYLIDNKALFFKTYIQIGLSNPAEYIKAWIYETQGYWSLKESFTLWYDGIEPNTYGIARSVNSSAAETFVDTYAEKFIWIFRILTIIAVYTWIVIAAFCAAINRRNRLGAVIAVPAVSIFLSLLVAVPLDAEFRYAYAYIFLAPIVLIAGTLITAQEEP